MSSSLNSSYTNVVNNNNNNNSPSSSSSFGGATTNISAPGFGLPAPVQGTGSFENQEIAKLRREQMMRSSSNNNNNNNTSSGPYPHPVPSLHGPASPIHIPNKSPAPTRGCSPTRFRMKMSSNADRSATEMSLNNSVVPFANNNNNNNDISMIMNRSNPSAVLTNTNANDKSPSVRMRGPLNSGGHDFVVDHHQDGRQHSPSGASCPVCGALRLPNVDLRNDATLAVLDKRRAELQRELFKIDQMMMNRKRTQPNVDHNFMNPDATPQQPALTSNQSTIQQGRTFGVSSTVHHRPVFPENSTIASVLNSQPQSHNNSPSRRQQQQQQPYHHHMSSSASAAHSTSSVSRDHASLINDLRQTADSLLNTTSINGPGGSTHSSGSRHNHQHQQQGSAIMMSMSSNASSPSRPRTPRGTHDAFSNLSRNGKPIMVRNHPSSGTHASTSIITSMNGSSANEHQQQQQQEYPDLSSTEIAIANMVRGNVNPNIDQHGYKMLNISSSTPAARPGTPKAYQDQLEAAEDEVRQMLRSGARAGRPNPPASSSSTFPSLEQSPMRDEMYSDDHRDTLKELAMLRVERQMRGA